MDRDGSGKIDNEEIYSMLQSLGVSPNHQDVQAMLETADVGEKDGKIDMREWLMWYAKGVQGSRDLAKEDASDAFSKLAGDSPVRPGQLPKAQVREFLRDEYGLDFSAEELNSLFDTSAPADAELTFDEFCHLLVPQPQAA